VLPTEKVCAAGEVPPIWDAKVSALGVSVRFGVAATTSVTGTLSGLFDAPLDANATVPW
jgi:hypothetical protein